jgi:hypothetical protein
MAYGPMTRLGAGRLVRGRLSSGDSSHLRTILLLLLSAAHVKGDLDEHRREHGEHHAEHGRNYQILRELLQYEVAIVRIL